MNAFQSMQQIAEAELSRIRQELPRELREPLAQVTFHLEQLPSPEEVASGIDPDQLGLFDGNALGEFDFPTPTRIVLWLENLWDLADGNEADFREEVRITLLHEIGHYFGWDEADLEERDLD